MCVLISISETRVGLSRESGTKQDDGAQRAGFAIDRSVRAVGVVPDLRGQESDLQRKDDRERRQHTRRHRLEGAGTITDREVRDDEVEHGGREIDRREDGDGHPADGECKQPVAHNEARTLRA